MSQANDWVTAEAAVESGIITLRAARTHRDIRVWAQGAGVATKTLWPKVKVELRKQLDIDYDELRTQVRAAEAADLAQRTAAAPLIELYSAGDAEVSRYAVCAAHNERESWFGAFHAKDAIYRVRDDFSAEHSAADKAVFLAGRAREKVGLDTVRLVLHVSHHELTDGHVAFSAAKHRVAVMLDPVEANPAVDLCREPGYRTWREIKLDSLVVAEHTNAGE